MSHLASELRYAVRSLLEQRAVAVAAVLTLTLGTGPTTAVFSIVHAAILAPLPYSEPDRLVSIGSLWTGFVHSMVSLPEYVDYGREATGLESIAAYQSGSAPALVGSGEPEYLDTASVTPSLFDVLRVRPALGRAFTPAEGAPGEHRVAILSDGVWRRAFAAAPDVLRRELRLNGEPYTVVGVMPAGFAFPERETAVWIPMTVDPADQQGRGAHSRSVIARLKPGVTVAHLQAEMTGIGERLQQRYPGQYPPNSGWGVSVRSLHDHEVGPARRALTMLLGTVGLVLLIACANVASLLMAHAAARRRDLAIRTALGAPRRRLVAQLFIQALLLAGAGALLGVALAHGLVRAVVWLDPAGVPRLQQAAINVPVLAFTAAAAIGTAIIFGLGPALVATRQRGSFDVLKEGGGGTMRGTSRARQALVAVEVGLALVLLVGAALFARSLGRLLDVHPGLEPAQVMTSASITLPPSRYRTDAQIADFYTRLVTQMEQEPGVERAGAISVLPLTGMLNDWTFSIEGRPRTGAAESEQSRVVTPGYFETVRIPVVAGRVITDADAADAPAVVVVSESFARKYWPGDPAVGRRLKRWSLEHPGPWRTVVGVVGDVRHAGLGEAPTPAIYYPVAQTPGRRMSVVARGGADAVAAALRRVVRSMNPEQPLHELRPLQDYAAESVSSPRFQTVLVNVFAALALGLAAVGLYGLLAHTIVQRQREIGVRLALGASAGEVLRWTMTQGLRPVGFGLIAGWTASLWFARLVRGLLFDVPAIDTLSFTLAPLVLIGVALLALLAPARRATRVDPIVTLRAE